MIKLRAIGKYNICKGRERAQKDEGEEGHEIMMWMGSMKIITKHYSTAEGSSFFIIALKFLRKDVLSCLSSLFPPKWYVAF